MLEMGIYQGGSAALAMLTAEPARLVAFDISDPLEALETFRTERGLSDRLRTHYGLDQSDRARLSQMLDDEFGETPIDLIIDDASHLHDETVASFEVAFPRLRPGGEFVIEDWAVGPIMALSMEELLDDENFEQALVEGPFTLAEGSAASSTGYGPITGSLLRALAAGGAPARRAEAIIAKLSWPTDNPRPTQLSAMVAGLAATTATRPGEIESFECTHGLITVVRGPADLPRDGWQLERYPGQAAHLLGVSGS